MPISSLSSNISRQLGSSQLMHDARAAVKELVDNALDADATAVFVDIAVNTVDLIQVRDNGTGVEAADRPQLCRPNSTSKIRGLDELYGIGGRWLGFRGQALAGLANLCGSFQVLTRVETEDVAVSLTVDRKGEIRDEKLVSHPIGTTVKAIDLFHTLPVRKRAASGVSEKTLLRIKRLMQEYAFARPIISFSLRILRQPNHKCNWSYAPRPNFSILEMAQNIVPRSCSSQCIEVIHEAEGFKIQALLPRPDAELSKVNSVGPFIAVDSRPVTAERGTVKEMVRLFKQHLRKSHKTNNGDLRNPFVFLCISCPSGAYDITVDPAKDQMLFRDAQILLDAMTELLAPIYPPAAAQLQTSQSEDPVPVHGNTRNQSRPGFAIFEDGPFPAHDFSQPTSAFSEAQSVQASRDSYPSTQIAADGRLSEVHRALRDITTSNPWTSAKANNSSTNAPFSTPRRTRPIPPTADLRAAEQPSPLPWNPDASRPRWFPPTPINSSPITRPQQTRLHRTPQSPSTRSWNSSLDSIQRSGPVFREPQSAADQSSGPPTLRRPFETGNNARGLSWQSLSETVQPITLATSPNARIVQNHEDFADIIPPSNQDQETAVNHHRAQRQRNRGRGSRGVVERFVPIGLTSSHNRDIRDFVIPAKPAKRLRIVSSSPRDGELTDTESAVPVDETEQRANQPIASQLSGRHSITDDADDLSDDAATVEQAFERHIRSEDDIPLSNEGARLPNKILAIADSSQPQQLELTCRTSIPAIHLQAKRCDCSASTTCAFTNVTYERIKAWSRDLTVLLIKQVRCDDVLDRYDLRAAESQIEQLLLTELKAADVIECSQVETNMLETSSAHRKP